MLPADFLTLLVLNTDGDSTASVGHLTYAVLNICFWVNFLGIHYVSQLIFGDDYDESLSLLIDDFVDVLLVDHVAYFSRSKKLLSDGAFFLLLYLDDCGLLFAQLEIFEIDVILNAVHDLFESHSRNHIIFLVLCEDVHQICVFLVLLHFSNEASSIQLGNGLLADDLSVLCFGEDIEVSGSLQILMFFNELLVVLVANQSRSYFHDNPLLSSHCFVSLDERLSLGLFIEFVEDFLSQNGA